MAELINRSGRERSLFGLQWYLGPSEQLLKLLRESAIKPAVIKAISGFDKLPLVMELCGDQTIFIARDFLPDKIGGDFRQLLRHVGGDPKAAAIYDFQKQFYRIEATPRAVVWETSVNEFFPYPNEDPVAAWKAYASYCLEYCKLMDGHGRKAAVFTTTCGTPEPQFYPLFRDLVSYVHKNGHYLVPHEYKGLWSWHWWGPNQEKQYRLAQPPKVIREPGGLYAGWLVGRFLQMLVALGYGEMDRDTLEIKRLDSDLPNIILGEYGQGPLNTERTFVDNYRLSAIPDAWRTDSAAVAWRTIDGLEPVEGYLQDQKWLDDLAHMGGLKGICHFVSLPQAHPQWKWYDIGGECMERIFAHIQDYQFRSPGEQPGQGGEEQGMSGGVGVHMMPLAPSGIPVYQSPSGEGSIAGIVYPGDILKSLESDADTIARLGQEGSFLKISYAKGPIEGWVGAWLVQRVYVNLGGSAPPSPPPVVVNPGGDSTAVPPQENGIPLFAVTYASSGLNIRKGPGLNFAKVSKASMGEKLTVLGSRADALTRFCKPGEWIPVRLPDGVEGWAMALWLHRLSDGRTPWLPAVSGHALIGLHGPSDPAKWAWDASAYDLIKRSRVEAVKLLAAEDMDGTIPAKLKSLGVKFIMARIMAKFHTAMSPESIINDVIPVIDRLYQGGVRYFEVLNEPNLSTENSPEGMWVAWQNGREFAEYLIRLLELLRRRFPQAKFGWPGLSPGPYQEDTAGKRMRYDAAQFLAEAEYAARACDFICLHAYWNEGGFDQALDLVDSYCQRFRDKMIIVSEFSNTSPHVSKDVKAFQYLSFYEAASTLPVNLGPLMSYVLSSSWGYGAETWAGSEIPDIIGERDFA